MSVFVAQQRTSREGKMKVGQNREKWHFFCQLKDA